MKVAIAHDYLTQRGGAERVVLTLLQAFPGAPLYTSLYEPTTTFPEFRQADIRTMSLNRLGPLRRNHRLALPLLSSCWSNLEVDADVVLCSSSGWAHALRSTGRKVVYCYTPARWLYQTDSYLGEGNPIPRLALRALRGRLIDWDRSQAAGADRYLTLSSAVKDRIRTLYGIDAEILPPPHCIDPAGERRVVEGIEPGYFLCVSRLLPYKNVRAVIEAFERLPAERLVVVGTGPEEQVLRASAPTNVEFVGTVTDEQLRWLYSSCAGVLAASYEDFGLTPVEGAAFGKPAAALRWGGFLDTIVEGTSGVFFDRPEPAEIAAAVGALQRTPLPPAPIVEHAKRFSADRFIARIRQVVEEEMVESTGK
ncbi:MAG: glycosyltransferase [Actinomycetota bacterium]